MQIHYGADLTRIRWIEPGEFLVSVFLKIGTLETVIQNRGRHPSPERTRRNPAAAGIPTAVFRPSIAWNSSDRGDGRCRIPRGVCVASRI